jgi:transcriptional regulator GlxA family with amidase domain
MTRRIVFIIYAGFEMIDLSGPAAVFTTANRMARARLYQVKVISPDGGPILCSDGVSLLTTPCSKFRIAATDTVLATGAYAAPLRAAMASKKIASILRRASVQAERFGSICAGTFLLSTAGLLSGKRVVTHWRGCEELATHAPDATVESEALYIESDRMWTSAGATAGIDMALAIVERDHGRSLMGAVARQLLVYSHRPGNQSQFSSVLDAQVSRERHGKHVAANGTFAELSAWLQQQTGAPVKVAAMAAKVGMSERNFYRRFVEIIGVSPAKYMERLRLDAAKRYLENHQAPKVVAGRVGFQSESSFRSAFAACFGVTPAQYQRMQRG